MRIYTIDRSVTVAVRGPPASKLLLTKREPRTHRQNPGLLPALRARIKSNRTIQPEEISVADLDRMPALDPVRTAARTRPPPPADDQLNPLLRLMMMRKIRSAGSESHHVQAGQNLRGGDPVPLAIGIAHEQPVLHRDRK